MRIFNRSGAIRDKQVEKEIAPLSARNVLLDRVREEDGKINSSLNKGSLFDKNEAAKNKKQMQDTFDKTCPETLSPEAKNRMWKEAKRLKDEFTVGMLSYDEIHPVKTFKDGESVRVVIDEDKMRQLNCVNRSVAWGKKNEEKIRKFKNIMRHLNPDDPMAADIEKFRPRRSNR